MRVTLVRRQLFLGLKTLPGFFDCIDSPELFPVLGCHTSAVLICAVKCTKIYNSKMHKNIQYQMHKNTQHQIHKNTQYQAIKVWAGLLPSSPCMIVALSSSVPVPSRIWKGSHSHSPLG